MIGRLIPSSMSCVVRFPWNAFSFKCCISSATFQSPERWWHFLRKSRENERVKKTNASVCRVRLLSKLWTKNEVNKGKWTVIMKRFSSLSDHSKHFTTEVSIRPFIRALTRWWKNCRVQFGVQYQWLRDTWTCLLQGLGIDPPTLRLVGDHSIPWAAAIQGCCNLLQVECEMAQHCIAVGWGEKNGLQGVLLDCWRFGGTAVEVTAVKPNTRILYSKLYPASDSLRKKGKKKQNNKLPQMMDPEIQGLTPKIIHNHLEASPLVLWLVNGCNWWKSGCTVWIFSGL